jgi:hypothetical protein
VLSVHEQRVWDDVQRFWAEEAEEPSRVAPPVPNRRRRSSRDRAVLQVAVVVGARLTVVLLLFGALVAGLAVGVATALAWALGRSWPQLREQGAPDASPDGGEDRTVRRRADEPGNRPLRGTGTPD